jgi:hypothetical protein
MGDANRNLGARGWWYLLPLVQLVAVLRVPFYNSVEPMWRLGTGIGPRPMAY